MSTGNTFAEQSVRVAADPEVRLFLAHTRGGRPLLVIHGGPEWDHSYLREPLAALAGRHRLLLPDLRGCGRSTAALPAAAFTPDAVVADLVALLDALDVAHADVLGFSYGGLLAQRLTVAAPERVRRLVIASSSVLPVDDADFAGWAERDAVRAEQVDVWPGCVPPDPRVTRADAFASARASVYRPESLPGYLARLERVRFTGAWQRSWLSGALPSARMPDAVARLAAWDRPILLLHGRQDMTFPVAAVPRTTAMLPNATAAIIENAGHMAHVDAPREWLTAVADFLA